MKLVEFSAEAKARRSERVVFGTTEVVPCYETRMVGSRGSSFHIQSAKKPRNGGGTGEVCGFPPIRQKTSNGWGTRPSGLIERSEKGSRV